MSLLCSGSAQEDTGRVTASCPSSPTETECSSGKKIFGSDRSSRIAKGYPCLFV